MTLDSDPTVIDVALANTVILGAVCHALAKAGAVEPKAFMTHLAAVRAEWIERSSGKAGLSADLLSSLMDYLEIQADFPRRPETTSS